MRVMCISHKSTSAIKGDRPDIGEICTVLEVIREHDCDWYVLKEYRKTLAWNTRNFVLISDQDNLQLTEQEAEEIRKRISKPVTV